MPQPEVIVHAPCAWNPRGATRSLCEQMTKNVMRNTNGCCKIRCTSRLRACRACVLQGGQIELSSNTETGLCSFHSEYGERAVRPKPKLTTQMPTRIRPVGPAPPLPARMPAAGTSAPAVSIKVPTPVLPRTSPTEPTRVPAGVAGSLKRSGYRRRKPRQSQGIKVNDPKNLGQTLSLPPLEVLALMTAMRDEEHLHGDRIAERLGLSKVYAYLIMRLERLVPEVKALLEPEAGFASPLPISCAAEIAMLRPELQEGFATKVVRGTYTLEQLKRAVRDPEMRAEARRRTKKAIAKDARKPKRIGACKKVPLKRRLSAMKRATTAIIAYADAFATLYGEVTDSSPDDEILTLVLADAAVLRKKLARLLVAIEDPRI